MFIDFAKSYLRDDLQRVRQSLVDRLDGLCEYDVRRPLTATGTNLLGLIKHRTQTEIFYLSDIFGRPFPELHPKFTGMTFLDR